MDPNWICAKNKSVSNMGLATLSPARNFYGYRRYSTTIICTTVHYT